MRKRIFEIIEVSRDGDRASAVYDSVMIVLIALSLLPLMYKESTPFLNAVDKIAVAVFTLDYLLRWSTADLKFGRRSALSFLRYPFSFMALIDLLSILPSLTVLNSAFKVLRMFRMVRALRVFRVLRAVRYSKSLRIIGAVLKNSRESLLAVGSLAVAYIFICSLVIFNAEPDSFRNFFEALYWSTVLLTTVGFGDITPVTAIGRFIAMSSSIFGIAIVALPSGIITAGYMKLLSADESAPQPPKNPVAEL
ncbi:MAG: ion transporter [Oscillospiraceae bacterium]|nr:ion transporter [Oscillospiraceae bacterium]